MFSLMTCCDVDAPGPGRIRLLATQLPGGLTSAAGEITYKSDQFDVQVEVAALTDTRLPTIWGARLVRILLTSTTHEPADEWGVVVRRTDLDH